MVAPVGQDGDDHFLILLAVVLDSTDEVEWTRVVKFEHGVPITIFFQGRCCVAICEVILVHKKH